MLPLACGAGARAMGGSHRYEGGEVVSAYKWWPDLAGSTRERGHLMMRSPADLPRRRLQCPAECPKVATHLYRSRRQTCIGMLQGNGAINTHLLDKLERSCFGKNRGNTGGKRRRMQGKSAPYFPDPPPPPLLNTWYL